MGQTFKTGIGFQTIETQDQSSMEYITGKLFPACYTGKQIRKVRAQRRFLEDIQQACQRPAIPNGLFETPKITGLRLRIEWGKANRLFAVWQELYLLTDARHGSI